MSKQRNPRFNIEWPAPTYRLLLEVKAHMNRKTGSDIPLQHVMYACVVDACRKREIPVAPDDVPTIDDPLRQHLRLGAVCQPESGGEDE